MSQNATTLWIWERNGSTCSFICGSIPEAGLISKENQTRVEKIAERIVVGKYIYNPGKRSFSSTLRIVVWVQKAKMTWLKLLFNRNLKNKTATEQDRENSEYPKTEFRAFQNHTLLDLPELPNRTLSTFFQTSDKIETRGSWFINVT